MMDVARKVKVRFRNLFFAAVTLMVAGALIVLHARLMDGLDGWFFSLGFEEDTQYAPGYSEEAFRSIRVGMKAEDVQAILGPPLDRRGRGEEETWRWSHSPGSKSYRVRAIVFQGDRVARIYRKFYVD